MIMADEKISDMPIATDLIGASIPIIQSGVNKKAATTLFGVSSGVLVMKGAWDASTNAVPNNGDASIKQGFVYDNGNFSSTTLLDPFGSTIEPYATIRALIDNPGPLLSDPTKWRITY